MKKFLILCIVILWSATAQGAEVVDFSGFLTGENFKFAESQGTSTSGASTRIVTCGTPLGGSEFCPLYNEKFMLRCDQQKTNNVFYSFMEFAPSNSICVGVWVRFTLQLPPKNEDIPIIRMFDSVTLTQISLTVERVDASNHRLAVYDANSALVASVSNPFSLNTWHLIEFRFQNSNTSTLDVWIDESSVMTSASEDFLNGATGLMRMWLRGQIGATPLAQPTNTYFNSYYIKNDCSSNSDFIGEEFTVEKYQIFRDSSTPDVGDVLDRGPWSLTSNGSEEGSLTVANYTSGHDGYVYLTDTPGDGLIGKIGAERTIYGGKWTYWGGTRRSTSYHVYVGKPGDIALATLGTGTLPSPWNVVLDGSNSKVPDYDESFAMGFGCPSGSGWVNQLVEAWAFLLVDLPVTTVHIRGKTLIKGGLIQ